MCKQTDGLVALVHLEFVTMIAAPRIMRSWMMVVISQSPNTLKTYNSLRRLQPTHRSRLRS